MINLKEICNNLSKEFSTTQSKEDILMSCVMDRLSSLYVQQSESLDKMLDDLTRSIDISDFKHTKIVIDKLSKSLSHNREHLLLLIERLK